MSIEDRIQQLNYEKDFRLAFLESKGDGFQRLFEASLDLTPLLRQNRYKFF